MAPTALAERLHSVTTDDDVPETRGQAIERRMLRLGLTQTALAEESGVERTTVGKALADNVKVQPRTYARIETALDRLEHEVGYGGPDVVLSTEHGLMEFEVTGDFGVRVVVKGPVANAEELEASVARLIRDIRTSPTEGGAE